MSTLLTLSQVEAELSLSRSTLLRAIQRGDLRVIRVGRAVRIPATELDRFIRERQAEAAAAR